MGQTYKERWETEESIGEGGQAHVFLAHELQKPAGQRYVLKRLKNRNRLDRFRQEVRAIQELDHPNILKLIDYDVEGERPFLVTEYCSGGSLEKAEPFWRSSPMVALELFQQVCEAVAYAHSQNVIHRDLKPANIFLRASGGSPVVGDFGICFFDDDGTRLTLTGEAVGPADFMAPELEGGRAKHVSSKSDVYSLGKLLYWLLSDRRILPREKHREPEFDLRRLHEDGLTGWHNIYLEHINRVLDLMISENPENRRGADNISLLVKAATRLIQKEITPIGKGLPEPCGYCGQGVYGEDSINLLYFGTQIKDPANWRLLVCNQCGHVQLFRKGENYNREWWKPAN